jgi:ribosomal protein L37AE/L43A
MIESNNPYSLYVSNSDHIRKCAEEDDNDVRHLGRHLWFEYFCENCGTKAVYFSPDYPYVEPNSIWTCDTCAASMLLCSYEPLLGEPKKPKRR